MCCSTWLLIQISQIVGIWRKRALHSIGVILFWINSTNVLNNLSHRLSLNFKFDNRQPPQRSSRTETRTPAVRPSCYRCRHYYHFSRPLPPRIFPCRPNPRRNPAAYEIWPVARRFFSGRRGGVFHLLGPVPRAAAVRHIRVQHVRPGLAVAAPAVQHSHVRVRRAVLRVHHHQPDTVPHHVAEVPVGVQGMYRTVCVAEDSRGRYFIWADGSVRRVERTLRVVRFIYVPFVHTRWGLYYPVDSAVYPRFHDFGLHLTCGSNKRNELEAAALENSEQNTGPWCEVQTFSTTIMDTDKLSFYHISVYL